MLIKIRSWGAMDLSFSRGHRFVDDGFCETGLGVFFRENPAC